MPPAVRITLPGGDGVRARRALVIGVEKYAKPIPRLPTCAVDAIRVARVLAAHGYVVKALHDGPGSTAKPTRAAVLAAVTALARAADADDLVVVYAACHGRLIDRRPYLMLSDTPDDDVAGRGLPLAELLTRLRGGPRWAAIFLDVCRMGLGLDPTTSDTAEDADARDGGFALLAASTSLDKAQDSGDTGIFSKHLALGLAGLAADPAGAVRVSALGRHVQEGVERWRKGPEGSLKTSSQTPVLRLEVADLELASPPVYRELSERLTQRIIRAAFSPSGKLLATGSDDGSVRLWDPATGAAVREPMQHHNMVRAISFSADGRRLWSVDADGGVQCWNVARATAMPPAPARLERPGAFGFTIDCAAWSPTVEGQLIAAFHERELPGVTDPQTIDFDDPAVRDRIVDHDGVIVRDGRTTRRLAWPGGSAGGIAWGRAAGRFYTGGGDGGDLLAWSTRTGRTGVAGRYEAPLFGLAVSPDGKALVAGGGAPGMGTTLHQPRIWRIAARTSIELAGHRGLVTAIAYSADGARIATGGFDGLARVWDAGGQLLRELPVVAGGVRQHPEVWAVAFSPDGRRLFVGYGDGSGRVFELGARP